MVNHDSTALARSSAHGILMNIKNALTVDVEDYFHVAAFSNSVSRNDWSTLESRVEKSTHVILRSFDDASVKATFFVLGWVAERYPNLVKDIIADGHELACHGYSHQLIYKQSRKEFREETIRAKSILEDVSGQAVHGYRAASYSITPKSFWAMSELAQAGFVYDSSIVPVRHDYYGIPGSHTYPFRLVFDDGMSISEFPPSTVSLAGFRIPIGGGGYFRLFPYWFSKWGLRKINNRDSMPSAFYLHPWEIDPGQPRISAGWRSTFRHYNNLHKVEERLSLLLRDFAFAPMGIVLSQLSLADVSPESILENHEDRY